MQKTSFVMEAGSLSILLCALFMFSAEGALKFTKEPQNPFPVMEGDNITLEWKYTYGEGESLFLASFTIGRLMVVTRFHEASAPTIADSYKGRVHANMENNYTSITFLDVNRKDTGSYKFQVLYQPVMVRTSRTVEILVLYLDQPHINSTDTRPAEGTNVNISCIVNGEPTPNISWSMNETPLNASGNSRISLRNDNELLTIMNVDRRDSGGYKCLAQNSLGNVTSNSSTLSVEYQPEIILNPLNATRAEGKNVTWSCNATGKPEPSLSWIFNGSHINTNYNPKMVLSKDRRKMTITNVSRTDSGEYQCLATNDLGNASSQAVTLDVLYIPGITAHPQNETKKEGDNATFICIATANPLPNISWNKEGTPLSNNSRVSLSAENKHLTITNVDKADNGEYRCVATNSLGNDTSNPAYLEVQYKPEISPLPRMIQKTEGEQVTIFCNATGNPLPTISWTIDGNSVDTSNGSRMNLSHKGNQFTINNVNRRNSGLYQCVAENSLGNVTSHGATLQVLYIPEVTILGGSQQFAVIGNTKKLICKYNAVPPVSEVQWIKDGNVISRNSSLLIRNDSRLTVPYYDESQIQLLIIQSTSDDGGNYTCLVSNTVGNSSQKTSIISQELPSITIHPQGKNVIEGNTITLFCNATGNPEPSISWVKDGFSIENNSRISFSQENEQLAITNVSRTDSGEYQCVAKNRVGNDTSNSKVDVHFEPEVSNDGNQKQYVAKGGNIRLICRYEASPPVLEVQWIKDGTVIARNASKMINGSRMTILSFNESQIQVSITVASLKDGGNYTCKATNILSSTQDTTMIIIEDKPEIATHPLNITTEEGRNVILYCNATGNPVPTISWTKDGNPLINCSRIILSVSQEQLTITKVNRIDGGKYKCQAKNRVGTDNSYASTVNVQYQAEIVSHPQVIVTEEEGNNFTLFCNATGNPPAKISWTKDGSLIGNNSRINFSEDNERLNIRNVNRKDKGSYRCVANNSLGNDTSNVSTVDIQYRPEIAALLQDITKPEGENVSLICNATGNPEPELSWFKDEHLVNSSNRISFSAGNKSLMIANVNRTDSGKYLCVAHNEVGNATSSITILNVEYQPEIITDPCDVSVKEGKNTALYCNATGNPLPTISWKKNGNPIGNNSRISYSAESKELKIINVNRTDSGTYRCVAVNSIDNATSRDATLDVEYQSEITTHPSNATKREGENVTLHCNATGNPLPTLSWTKDGSDLGNNSRITFTGDKNELTITSAKQVDSGAYRCVANNSLGNDTSNAAVVNVQYQGKITTHPSNMTKREGENVTLHCNATGNPLPTLSWTKVGSDITKNPRISISEDKKQLAITFANREDRGGYLCVAHNEVGNDSLIIAIVDVQYRPEIASQPQIVTKPEGENVTLTCNATGNPEPELLWFKDDEHLVRSSNRISLSAGNRSLMIANVNRTNNGKYLCVAHNEFGNATSNITKLNVQYQSEITTHPSNVTKIEGENVTLHCNATGNPLPTLSWTKDGSEISNNPRISFSEDKNQLTITKAERVDSGAYRCVASNSLGSNTSDAAVVNVQFIPDPPQNITVDSKGSRLLNISWVAGLNGNSKIQNYTVEISEDNQIFKDVDCEGSLSSSACVVSSPSTTASLSGLFPWTAYNIRVFATNTIGKSNSSHILNVTTDEEEPSEAPTFVVTVLNSTTVNVSWQVLSEDKARGAIFGYYVLYRVNSTLPWFNITIDGAETTSLLTGPLNEHTTYEFAMQVFNGKGVSNLSGLVKKTTAQHKPSGPPQQVTLSGLTSTSIRISWDPVPAADRNGIIKGYRVKYQALPDGDNATEFFNISIKQQDERVTKILNHLNMFTNYSISVLAFTMFGDGPPSATQFVQTLQDKPSAAPWNVRGHNISSTSILVEWDDVPAFDQNGIITSYTITYVYCSQTEFHNGTAVAGPDDRRKKLTGLRKYANYNIKVHASTSKGDGPDSYPVVVVRTEQDKPSAPPSNIRGHNSSSTSILVEWGEVPPADQNGVILAYTISYQSLTQNDKGSETVAYPKEQLQLTGLKKFVNYSITLFASTVKGNGNRSDPILVITDQDKPSGPPQSITVSVTSSRSISVSWDPVIADDRNGIIKGYRVKYQALPNGDNATKFFNISIEQQDEVVTQIFDNMNEFTNYSIRLSAFTVFGNGPASVAQVAETLEDKPSGAPHAVTVSVASSRIISVSWDPVFAEARNGIIKGYQVNYQALANGYMVTMFLNITREQQNERQSVTLDHLNEFTIYNVTVSAFTVFGSGPASVAQVVQTLEDKPSGAPQAVTVSVASSKSISVSWDPVIADDRNGIIKGYRLTYQALPNGDMVAKFLNTTCEQQNGTQILILDDLNEFTNYSITVLAFTVFGNGPASVAQVAETLEDRPSRGPENVSSSQVNDTTKKITWVTLPKEVANGLIELYEVRFELKESCLKVDSTFHTMNTTKSSVLLTVFWMCAKYEVSVRGYTVAGPGPYSKAVVVQTKSLKLSKMWSKETPSSPTFSQTSSGEGITAKITLPRFPGNASFFQVIVIRYSLDYTGVVNSPDSFTPKDLMTYEEAHKSSAPAAYVTFQFRAHDFDAFREFVVGDGAYSNSETRKRRSSNEDDFHNKPLQPNTKYKVFLRAFIDKTVYISSNFVTIETKDKPNVKGLPERTIFRVGDVVVLTCEATGDPKPSVSWSKDGNTNIPRAQFRNDNHILVIQEVAPTDGGIYECRASNAFGQRRTATAVVIAVPPSIREDVSPPSVTCAKDTPCSLLCHATSDIPFNYSWTRNGQALEGRNIKVIKNTVIVTPLDDQDFGDYVCHATNSFGSTTYKITLSESQEEGNNVRSVFRAGDIAWSCIVFVLLVLIGVLIWWLRRAQANSRRATAEEAIVLDTVQSVVPLEKHVSEPGSYMELRPRPSDGQTRVPSEYQSLQEGHANAGYYNVVPKTANKKGPNEEIYEEIELSDR